MRTSLFLAAVLAVPSLFAGVRIEQESTDVATGEVTKHEILLDSNRLRINTTGKTSSSVLFLTDGGRNRFVTLDKARNEYREIDPQAMAQTNQQLQGALSQADAKMQEAMKNMTPEQRAMMEQVMKGRGMPGQPAAAQPVRTVYTAKGGGSVNGFSCTKYDGMRGAEKVEEVCAAKPTDLKFSAADFQIFEKVREFASSLQVGNARVASLVQSGYEGYPVQRTAFTSGQPSEKTETKSLQRVTLGDADFSLGDAKKIEIALPPTGKR